MKPTIGRIVIYTLRFPTAGVTELPAIVTRVLSDTCVNLLVFGDGTGNYWESSVLLGPHKGDWHWPERT